MLYGVIVGKDSFTVNFDIRVKVIYLDITIIRDILLYLPLVSLLVYGNEIEVDRSLKGGVMTIGTSWGWPKAVADIYDKALSDLQGEMSPLHYGPAHII